jgi:hypothetical protein
VAVVGPETAWPGPESTCLGDISAADGLGNTILIAEEADSGIIWLEPRDLELNDMEYTVNPRLGRGMSSKHPRKAMACFGDGMVRPLPNDLPPETLRALLTISGGEEVSQDEFP